MNFPAFFAYIFVTAFTPGPNNIMSMTNANRLGLRKSFPFNLGIFAGTSVIMALCALFGAAVYALIPKIGWAMRIFGALYMLVLAWKIYQSDAALEAQAKGSGFISGMLLQFVNPKLMIYAVTSLSTYVLPHYNRPGIILAFAALLSLVGFASTLCWAAFGTLFKTLFVTHAKLVNAVMALLLVYCAVSLFL